MVFNLNGKESYLVAYLTLLFSKVVQLITTFFTFYNHTLINLFVNNLYPLNIIKIIYMARCQRLIAFLLSLVLSSKKNHAHSFDPGGWVDRVGSGLSGLYFGSGREMSITQYTTINTEAGNKYLVSCWGVVVKLYISLLKIN